MSTSISKEKIYIDENKRVAIIYTIPDILEFIVEIHYNNESYFIKKSQLAENERFKNLADAKAAAKGENAEECFLALSKSYQEIEPQNAFSNGKVRADISFDYLPLHL